LFWSVNRPPCQRRRGLYQLCFMESLTKQHSFIALSRSQDRFTWIAYYTDATETLAVAAAAAADDDDNNNDHHDVVANILNRFSKKLSSVSRTHLF